MKLWLLFTVHRSDEWCIVRAENEEGVRQALRSDWWDFYFDRDRVEIIEISADGPAGYVNGCK